MIVVIYRYYVYKNIYLIYIRGNILVRSHTPQYLGWRVDNYAVLQLTGGDMVSLMVI